MILASIPSPGFQFFQLGPLRIHAYALCIIAGIVVAVWLAGRRWAERGGQQAFVADAAIWAVPLGIIGGRLYHVITDPELYFDPGRNPIDAFKIWDGGLGIWGAITCGGLGVWIACRRAGVKMPPFADAAAPGIILAQGIGRLGNWFNQELYGGPSTLPWAVHIDPAFRPAASPDIATYHPTFLYELVWDVAVAFVLIWLDRRFRLGHGRVFASYVALYTFGRFWIERIRVDHANEIFGLRVNEWVAMIVFLFAVSYLVISRGRRRETPDELYRLGRRQPPSSPVQ